MSTRRVFEVARELNMTNKELLAKLHDLGYDQITHHSNSLDEATISEIKAKLFGKKDARPVEEVRVAQNIIRRRKKKAEPPPSLEPEQEQRESEGVEPEKETTDEKTTEKEALPQEPSEAGKEAAAEKESLEDGKKAPVPEQVEDAASTIEQPETSQKTPTHKRIKKKKTTHEAAIVIEKPEVHEPEKEAKDTAQGEQAAPAAMEETSIPEPEVKEEVKEKKDSDAIKEPAIESVVSEPAAPEPEKKEAAEPEPEKKEKQVRKPAKKKKKKKKDIPAKVISLPDEIEEPVTPHKPETLERPAKVVPFPFAGPTTPEPEAQEKVEKKKKKKKRKKSAGDELAEAEAKVIKPVKKKGGFRQKAVVEGDALYDHRYGRSRKSKKKDKGAKKVKAPAGTQITVPKAIKRRIKMADTIVLSELAKRMGIKVNELIAKLMGMGMMVTANQTIDFDTATLVATEFGFETEKASFEEETIIKQTEDAPEALKPRPPVVTIMGHVDHGKTSLLDTIRKSNITQREAGGITQHIGAYHVKLDSGDIVFLDTPGHEAFTAMRARGAKVTDIVILVVAADDGVMPQTIEAIDHAKAANVPIIVAVNKIDKPEADPERIKRELAEKGLIPEDWGGETIFVNVSAKTGEGIDELLEMILLQAEVMELKANPDKLARGYIIESRLESGRGPVATVLVTDGTLHVGDPVVSGTHYGKIRAMFSDLGQQVKEAGPSIPVEIIGLSGVPNAGDELISLEDEKTAKQISEHRAQKQRAKELAKANRLRLENLFEQMQEGEIKELNIIIKADVQGSIEAIRDSLLKLSTDEVKINIIHAATGTIHESDISLASVSNAIIIGFNVRPPAKVAQLAEEENVEIRYYNVIYNLIKDVKDSLVGMMAPEYEEKVLGRAEVRQVFSVPNVGVVAGCLVTDGKVQRNADIRLIRDGVVIHEGRISSLKRFKDDVREVTQNYECGIGIEKFNDIKIGDVIECFVTQKVEPKMEADE